MKHREEVNGCSLLMIEKIIESILKIANPVPPTIIQDEPTRIITRLKL